MHFLQVFTSIIDLLQLIKKLCISKINIAKALQIQLSEPKAQVWVPRGYGFWLFIPYDLQCGWTNFRETFRDCSVHGRDGLPENFFSKKIKR